MGAWHPFANLQINVQFLPSSVNVSSIKGDNWLLLSSCSPFQLNRKGLVHQPRNENCYEGNAILDVVAFRGYVLDPPFHSWSDSECILNYWSKEHYRHNGVFSSIIISNGGRDLKFISDAFGISPLYYRKFNGIILFSTNSRFLTTAYDHLNLIVGRIFLETKSVYTNHSLTEGVYRVPSGSILQFHETNVVDRKWFSLSDLPTGSKFISLAGLQEIENAFQRSINRCLLLKTSGYVLPLSSGYDSRRILAALHSKDVPFTALTVRILQKKNRDLDAHWASVMSKTLGFIHHVVEIPPPDEFAQLDFMRRLLVDSHGIEHTWFLSMFSHIPNQPSLVFDGLGGDVLGNAGTTYQVKEIVECETSRKLSKILEIEVTHVYERILKKKWGSVHLAREMLREYLDILPVNRNTSILAYLLTRTRFGPGMSFQRLIPAGHLTVYPYFDLDYVCAALEIDPIEKIPPNASLQARCLVEFWPSYYAFPGSNNIPSQSKSESPAANEQLWFACFQQLLKEAGYPTMPNNLLTARANAIFSLAQINISFSRRARWWLEPFLLLLTRQKNQNICWENVK